MTERLFSTVIQMSLTGGLVILAVLALRIAMRRMPKIFSYCLWAVVLFRLLCPVSFSSGFSLLGMLPSSETLQDRLSGPSAAGQLTEGVAAGGQPVFSADSVPEMDMTGLTDAGAAMDSKAVAASGQKTQNGAAAGDGILRIAAGVWLFGIALLAVYSLVSLYLLKKKLKGAVFEKDNIFITDKVETPFVLGILKPCIYLPALLSDEEREYILLHEQIHVKRCDHMIKLISYMTLCLHWFNPLVWAAFFLSGKDMEMSCDEAVVRRLGNGVKKDYTSSLLSLAAGRYFINGTPLAFGEGDTGSRIKNVLRYKRPKMAVTVLAVAVCAASAAFLLANPVSAKKGTIDKKKADVQSKSEPQVFYGVIQKMQDMGGELILNVPGLGEMEIPKAGQIGVRFERDEQQLMAGDLVKVTFNPVGGEVSVMETWPGQFSADAESIEVMWMGLSMERTDSGNYYLSFAKGILPLSDHAVPGDFVNIYLHKQGGQRELLVSSPILEITQGADKVDLVRAEFTQSELEALFAGFGSSVSFGLQKKDTKELFLGSGSNVTLGQNAEGVFLVSVRSVSRSARVIDAYVSEFGDSYDEEGGGDLAFAEDCGFWANYGMINEDYREITFDEFADYIGGEDRPVNMPCLLTFENNLIVKAVLRSAYEKEGICYSELSSNAWAYDYIEEQEGEGAFEKYFSIARTETADLADSAGSETVEVYTGDSDYTGDCGVLMVKSADGRILYMDDANTSRAGWNNLYLGKTEDGMPYLLKLYIENRGMSCEYGFWAFRLDENGGIRQMAGSLFDFGPDRKYSDELFKEWVGHMEYYLKNSHLLLSSQDAVVRTEAVCEADKYNYDTMNLVEQDKERKEMGVPD